MTTWTDGDLAVLGPAPEVFLTAHQPDGTLSPPTTVWIARVQNELYVRSVYGANDPFFQGAIKTGRGRISVGKAQHDVILEGLAMAPPAFAVIDSAFRAKYFTSPPAIMGAIAGGLSAQATLRIVPA